MNAPKLKITKAARVGIAAVTLPTIKGLLAQVPDHATMSVSVPTQTRWDGDSLPVTTFQFTWEDIEEEPRPSGQDLPDAALIERMAKAMHHAESPDGYEWGECSEGYRESRRDSARAALAVVRAEP